MTGDRPASHMTPAELFAARRDDMMGAFKELVLSEDVPGRYLEAEIEKTKWAMHRVLLRELAENVP